MKTKILINVIEEVRDPETDEVVTKSTYEYHTTSHIDAIKAFRHLATRMASFNNGVSSETSVPEETPVLDKSKRINIHRFSIKKDTFENFNSTDVEREDEDEDEERYCEFMQVLGNHWCGLEDDARNPIYCVYNSGDYEKCKIRETYLNRKNQQNQ